MTRRRHRQDSHFQNGNGRTEDKNVRTVPVDARSFGVVSSPDSIPVPTQASAAVGNVTSFTWRGIEDLKDHLTKLGKLGVKGVFGAVLCGGAGSNFFEDVITLDPAQGLRRIFVTDLDVSGIYKTFRNSPQLQKELAKWPEGAITIAPMGGPEAKGFGAGATPSVGEAAARHPDTVASFVDWVQTVDIVIIIFAAGGGSGAGGSVVFMEEVIRAGKLGFNLVFMPDEKAEAWRRKSALEVIRRAAAHLPTIPYQNFSLRKWAIKQVGEEAFKKLSPKALWRMMNQREVLPFFGDIVGMMTGIGDAQNNDIENLRRFSAKTHPDAREIRYLHPGNFKMTQEQMRNPYAVDGESVVSGLFEDPLITDVSKKIDVLMYESKGGWSYDQSESIMDGVHTRIQGGDSTDPITHIRTYPAITEELPEGEPWSWKILGMTRESYNQGEFPLDPARIPEAILADRNEQQTVEPARESKALPSSSRESSPTPIVTENGAAPTAVPDRTKKETVQKVEAVPPAEKSELTGWPLAPNAPSNGHRNVLRTQTVLPTRVAQSASSATQNGKVAVAKSPSPLTFGDLLGDLLEQDLPPRSAEFHLAGSETRTIRFVPEGEKEPREFQVPPDIAIEFRNSIDNRSVSEERMLDLLTRLATATKGDKEVGFRPEMPKRYTEVSFKSRIVNFFSGSDKKKIQKPVSDIHLKTVSE